MMSLSLDETRPIDSRGRASPPGEASSGELSGEFIYATINILTLFLFLVALMGEAAAEPPWAGVLGRAQ